MNTRLHLRMTVMGLALMAGVVASGTQADDFAGNYAGFLAESDTNIKNGVIIERSLTNLLIVTQQSSTNYTAQVTDGEGHEGTVACVRSGAVMYNATRPVSYPQWNLLDFIMVSDGTNKACTVIGQDKTDPYDVSFTVSAWSEYPGMNTTDDFVGTWQAVQYSHPNLRDGSTGFSYKEGLSFVVTKTGADRIKVRNPKVSFSMVVSNNVASLVSAPVNAGAGLTHTFRMCTDGARMTACLVATELDDPTDVSVTLLMGKKVSGPAPAIRDLAMIAIKAPKTVTLTDGKPSQTKYVRAVIQNRGNRPETIPDLETLAQLVTLEVQSLGTNCGSPEAVFVEVSPQRKLPVTLKPKQKFNCVFTVTYDCANDELKNTDGDFSYYAEVHREVLDGLPDMDPDDDFCPHDAPVGLVDPVNPTIKDKGAGGKNPDGTYGADVVTDVVVK